MHKTRGDMNFKTVSFPFGSACSSVRVQLDSQPEIVDTLERRLLQLQVEATALEQETDDASQLRLKVVQAGNAINIWHEDIASSNICVDLTEISKLNEQLTPIKLQLQIEHARVDQLREFKNKLERLQQKVCYFFLLQLCSLLHLLSFSF